MTALDQARERQQAKRERDAPGSIVFKGKTYKGGGLFLGALKDEPHPDTGNWKPAQRMTIFVRKSLLPTPPKKRESFTCQGITFGGDGVAGQSPTSIAWIIKGIRWPAAPSA